MEDKRKAISVFELRIADRGIAWMAPDFCYSLTMTLLAAILGFLIPWKFRVGLGRRRVLASAFDAMALPLLVIAVKRWKQKAKKDYAALVLPGLLTLLLATHLAGPARVPALITIYAIWVGAALAELDAAELFSGLRAGVVASAALALPLWILAPRFVTDEHYFCAFAGSKNGFAFLAGLAAIETGSWLAAAAALLTGSRGAMLALTAAALVRWLRSGESRRTRLLFAFAIAAATFGLLLLRDLPADRFDFARSIIAYADTIPWNGIGPGSGFGLDLYFKSWLELGPVGFALLCTATARAIATQGVTPAIAFVLVFGAAHDPIHWPLFWLTLFVAPKSDFGEKNDP